MTELQKAQLFSFTRLLMNVFGGILVGRPESWAKELGGGLIALAGTWTYQDNKSGTPPTIPSKPVLPLLVCVALMAGCSSPSSPGTGWTMERFAVLAKAVTTEASLVHLEEKPQHRKTIELVVEQLNITIAADLYTPARLKAILKPLGIRELASKEGRIAIAGTVLIYDFVMLSTDTTADPKKLKPLFEGIRDGFQAALDATK